MRPEAESAEALMHLDDPRARADGRRLHLDLCARRREQAVARPGPALRPRGRAACCRADLHHLLRRAAAARHPRGQADRVTTRSDADARRGRRVPVPRPGTGDVRLLGHAARGQARASSPAWRCGPSTPRRIIGTCWRRCPTAPGSRRARPGRTSSTTSRPAEVRARQGASRAIARRSTPRRQSGSPGRRNPRGVADRHHRGHDPRARAAARLRRHQGLRGVGRLVGSEAGRAQELRGKR